jgi:hypothetical protein
MIMTLPNSENVMAVAGGQHEEDEIRRSDSRWPDTPYEIDGGGLTTVRITEGEGRYLLTATLSNAEQAHVTVDIAPAALRLRTGQVSRWVPIPLDALVDEAAVHIADRLLSVSIPLREWRQVRHVVHVW